MSPFRRFALPTVTLLAILLPGLLAVFLVQQQEQARLVGEAEDTLRQQTQQIGTAFDELFAPPRAMADSIRDARLLQLDPAEAQRTFFTLAGHAVRHLTQVNGVYLGFPDGSFLQQQQFVPARIADAIGDRLHADMGTRRQIRHLADGRIEDRWFYFDQVTEDWVPAPVATDPYDPRTRPWYQAAETATGTLWTAPYVFASTGKPGVTYAMRLSGFGGALWAVLGLDLTIETLSHILAERRAALGGQGSMIFATSPNGQIVGHAALNDDHGADLIEALHAYNRTGSIEQAFIDAAPPAGTVGGIRFNGTDYIISRAIMNSETAMPLHIYLAQRLDSVTASARADLRRNIWLLLLAMVIVAAIMAYAVKLRVEMAARRQAEQELVAARDQAEAATRAKSNFLATMSHEIRTPMNGVMSMAELLELTPLNGEQHRMAKVIRDSAQALLTVINDILDFSKIEAGKLEIEMVEFSLSDVVDGIGELLAPRADEKMLDLVVSIDPALADHRLGDPTRLRQVLLNLGSNAVKFTHDGSIHIRVTEIPGHKELLRFAVEDSGIGLSAEQMQRLFRPFEQADSSTARKYGGSGLGLSICQRLCELMGGRIGVNSIPGKGSTFWFELPLAAAGTETTRPDLAGLRVLLVGLPPLQQQAIAQYLPAEIIAAPGVAAARIAAAGRTFDLVLVDARCTDGALNAPVMLGLSATYGLVAPRGLVSTIDAAARTHFALALTYPLTGAGLRRAAAIALGQISAGSIASAFREDMAFTPPDLETAHEARAAILVAEDNATNRMVIHQMLSRMGYACEIAENGATALGLYHRHSYGLLLTDFHMPEMDGFELTGHIRSDESASGKPRLPIIALTADALTGTEQQCLDAGMDGYLTKPVNSRALAAMLQHPGRERHNGRSRRLGSRYLRREATD
ncbi:ATP-binding protein [Ferrovibrio sp.]|uniref:hybrid sensor histidine kinase/response regulator n=1 Tax=Ferrovibrio sp. TaxID=1917215 RepID=UPI0035AE1C30